MRTSWSKLAAGVLTPLVVIVLLAVSGCSSPAAGLSASAAKSFAASYHNAVAPHQVTTPPLKAGATSVDGPLSLTGRAGYPCPTDDPTPVKVTGLTAFAEGVASDAGRGVGAHASILVFKDAAAAKKGAEALAATPTRCSHDVSRGPATWRYETEAKKAGVRTNAGVYGKSEGAEKTVLIEQLYLDGKVVVLLDGSAPRDEVNLGLHVEPVLMTLRTDVGRVLKASELSVYTLTD